VQVQILDTGRLDAGREGRGRRRGRNRERREGKERR
jgi:hypothetical protein